MIKRGASGNLWCVGMLWYVAVCWRVVLCYLGDVAAVDWWWRCGVLVLKFRPGNRGVEVRMWSVGGGCWCGGEVFVCRERLCLLCCVGRLQ
ncbi:hypothetical protein Sjap_005843 [Stephania japonica]|uniref:Transmembrane protein n=1 Tax=Stephania japonica TaxID=461633 RepID=A0AAP0K5X8_9MAGN